MATVNLFQKFTVTDAAGNVYTDGSTTTAKTITAGDGAVFDRTYKIGATTIETLWKDESPCTTNFDFLWIESDVDGEIQLLCNENGTINTDNMEVWFVIKLKAGIPFCLASDASRNAGDVATTDAADMTQAKWTDEVDTWESTGSADVIDRIEFYSSNAAVVRCFAIT